MKLPGKRILLGTAIAAAALGAGGVAYATSNDPGPEQTYVTVEEEGAAGTGSGAADPRSGSHGKGGVPAADGRDCPEKDGNGQAQPEQSENGQAQPDQGESAQGLA